MQDQGAAYANGTDVRHEEGESPQEPVHDPSSSDNSNTNVLVEAVPPAILSTDDLGVKPYCRFFQRGYCRYGNGCRYSHDSNAPISVPKFSLLTHPKSATPCRFFQKGYCRYGDQCKFAHPNGLMDDSARFHQDDTNSDLHFQAATPKDDASSFTGQEMNAMTAQNGNIWGEDSREFD